MMHGEIQKIHYLCEGIQDKSLPVSDIAELKASWRSAYLSIC